MAKSKSKTKKSEPQQLSLPKILESVINQLPKSNSSRIAAEKCQEFMWWLNKAMGEKDAVDQQPKT